MRRVRAALAAALAAGVAAGGAAGAAPGASAVDDPVARRKALVEAGAEVAPFHVSGSGALAFAGVAADGERFEVEGRSDPGGATPEVAAEAREAVEAWIAAFNAGAVEAYLSFYAEDPRLHIVEAGRGVYRSRDEIVEAVRGLYAAVEHAEIRLLALSVTALASDRAFAVADFEQELAFDASTTLDLAGRLGLVLERGEGGWKVLAGDTAAAPPPGR